MRKKKEKKMIVFYVCVVLVLWIECKDRNEEVIQKKSQKPQYFFAFMVFLIVGFEQRI